MLNSLWNAANRPRGSIHNKWAESLFRGGLRFGLRPSEWRGSRFTYLDDGELALEVPNGKQSHGRAFGPTRTLIIDEARIDRLDPHTLEAALWLMENARLLSESEYRHTLDHTEQQMRRVLKRCGKPCQVRSGNVTLCTARHQFAANAKSDGLARETIAALMGHASIYTAGSHYGRKRSGRGGHGQRASRDGDGPDKKITIVSPSADDLYAVMNLERERQERRRNRPKPGPGMG